jgi:hypothetical protein
VNGLDSLDSLYLDDDSSLNEQIDTISSAYMYALVNKRHRLLTFDRETSFDQLEAQTCFVSGFEQSGPKFAMYLDGGADDGLGDLIKSVLHRPMKMQDPCDLFEFIGRLHGFCGVDVEGLCDLCVLCG